MSNREKLTSSRRWVVKIGSALLTNDGQGLDQQAMAGWIQQMAWLRQQGIEVVLVSSGSIAAGMSQLGWEQRPDAMHELQVAAAVGQMGLAQAWDSGFRQHSLQSAQVLLTHADLANRQRYLNARNALRSMLELGVLPVVNENDTVVTDEIRFGDNDTLGALVANLVEADTLVILTDQSGLFTADPRQNPDATLISESLAMAPELDEMAGGGSGRLGRGGMATKLRAARLAARSGASTVIVGGREPEVLSRLYKAESLGTLLLPENEPLAARKQWLAGHLQMAGKLVLDSGAVTALRSAGKSLLPVGVQQVQGEFGRGEMVACMDTGGNEIARGLSNYSAEEARRIIGLPSSRITDELGYVAEPELIHRDNLVTV
ncbi:glutamate 5-kinase [Endozoicomonadaceae bacterium StTr2]